MATEPSSATARAHPNIAFIKYWGNRDDELRLPANSSLSMNLGALFTETTVIWDNDQSADQLIINGATADEAARARVAQHLDLMRSRLGLTQFAVVTSTNNFPMGAGIASSASAFAALTVAATAAAGMVLPERELSVLARRGSGSASRSIPSGFVQWYVGKVDNDSYAESIAGPDHWPLIDVIAVISQVHKLVGSSHGHPTAATSDLQNARLAGAAARLDQCREALMQRDFARLAAVVEHDSNLMHAIMMTSQPALFYWQPATLAVMAAVRELRMQGVQVCYTLDAGPNVHCICQADDAGKVRNMLESISGVMEVLESGPGGAAQVVGVKEV